MDTTVTIKSAIDTSVYDATNTRHKVRRYTFYVGKLGPFTEDVNTDAGFDPNAFDLQIQPLINHLAGKN